MKLKLMLAASAWVLSTSAIAGEEILRGPVPSWLPALAPHLSNRPDNPSQHVRYEVRESHVRAFGTHTETYLRLRLRVLSPLGLQQASQLALEWNPALQTPTVHHALIVRSGETSDILEKADFTILRREAELEQSLQINGVLTGVLVNPDIRVGDTIDFAYSLRTQVDFFRNPLEALGSSYTSFPVDLSMETISWPETMSVQTRAGSHASLPPISQAGGFNILGSRRTDVEGEIYPESISTHSRPDYVWAISSIPDWGTIADQIRPAYEQASALPNATDLGSHIARIRSEHATPEAKALAALRLVQDEVRYMALTLGEGGWLPVSAREVWAGRQGDCKGKTVLLLALLRELEIDAVAVLVSSANLSLDQFLPMVRAFDHVIVKAHINGETYLLDGARIGDRSLTPDVPLVHEYVLPIVEHANLQQLPLRLPPRPTSTMHVEIDLSDGIYSPARLHLTDIDRGTAATEMQAVAAQLPAAELTRLYNERWNGLLRRYGQISDLKSQWEYRGDTHEFVASATARLVFDWSTRSAEVPLAHVAWRGLEPLEDEKFKDAKRANDFPQWSSFRTTVILPEGEDVVDLSVQPYDVEAGATRYFRTVQRQGNRLDTDRGSIHLRPFSTAAEVQSEQAILDSFKDLKATMQLRRGYTLSASDRQTLETAPMGNPELVLRRGYALQNEGDYVGAIAQFDVAIAAFPSPHANALANRALAYLSLNDLQKARSDIAAAEAADPNETILFHAKGRLAELEDDDLGAVLAFTGALSSWSENIHALDRRAAAYERMGQPARALADLERISTLRPENHESKVALARQLLRMGRAAEAYAQVERITQSAGASGGEAQIFVRIAQSVASQLKGSDPARAESVLTSALLIESDFPALLIDRATIRETQANSLGAAADMARFEQLTGIDLNDPERACQSQTVSWHSYDYALTMCDKAIQRRNDNATLHRRRGYLLEVLDRQNEAVAAYRTATELDPSNQRARFGLGRILKATGQATEGDALMTAALSADPNADEVDTPAFYDIRTNN